MEANSNIIVLDRGDYTTLTINLQGATITSWRINNVEYLFMSKTSDYAELKPLIGGIKYAFPYFGYSPMGPRHGFSRNIIWKLVDGPKKLKYGDIQATLQLSENAYTKSIWNFRFILKYTVTLYQSKIDLSVTVENPSSVIPLRFSLMRHSMIRVPNVTRCQISGFFGAKCFKNAGEEMTIEPRHKLTVDGPTLNLYSGIAKNILVNNLGKGISMRLCGTNKNGFIWHPWTNIEAEGCLEGGDHLHMLGIGLGITEQVVPPNGCYKSEECIKIIDEQKWKEKVELYDKLNNFPDYFDKYC